MLAQNHFCLCLNQDFFVHCKAHSVLEWLKEVHGGEEAFSPSHNLISEICDLIKLLFLFTALAIFQPFPSLEKCLIEQRKKVTFCSFLCSSPHQCLDLCSLTEKSNLVAEAQLYYHTTLEYTQLLNFITSVTIKTI